MSSFTLPVSPLRSAWLKVSLIALAVASLMLPAVADAQTTFSGGAASVTTTSAATSTIDVTGATGTVKTVSVELDGVKSDGLCNAEGTVCFFSLQEAEFLLAGPGGAEFVLLSSTGDGEDGCDGNPNQAAACNGLQGTAADKITVVDTGSPAPYDLPWLTSSMPYTVKPSSYWDNNLDSFPPLPGSDISGDLPQTDGCSNPFGIQGCAAQTLNGAFLDGLADGTWTLTLIDSDSPVDPFSITGWKLTLTYNSGGAAATTTQIGPSANPATYANSASSASVNFTATVSTIGSGAPTGSVAFSANGSTISGCGAVALSGSGNSSTATCTGALLAQGNNTISAVYTSNNTASFGGSSTSTTELVEVTPANPSGDQWCNNSIISDPLGGSAPLAYPSVIKINDAAYNSKTVSTVTVNLEGVAGSVDGIGGQFLLVAPGGGTTHNLDFLDNGWGDPGRVNAVDLTFEDLPTPNYVPNSTTLGDQPTIDNPYSATDDNSDGNPDTFPTSTSPTLDTSIPQVPGTINFAPPYGTGNSEYTHTNVLTFGEAFNGAPANGAWSLYTVSDETLTVNTGWCITLTLNTGNATATALTSTSNPATTGSAVTFTATVTSGGSPVTSGGTVTFLDNNATPAGTTGGNNVVSLNGSGVAMFTTSSLTEGDHTITASYSGTTDDNSSFSSVLNERINTATTATQVSATQWQYCDPGAIQIQQGTDAGPLTPNPSNIFVTNLPGTYQSVGVQLTNFSVTTVDNLDALASLVEGPTGTALDFFSNTTQGSNGNGEASLGNYIFDDGASAQVSSGNVSLSPGSYKPTAYESFLSAPDAFTSSASGFYPAPATFSYAPTNPLGTSQTFADVFPTSINPNGTWSLFFSSGFANKTFGAANGWCLNLTVTAPAIAQPTLSHVGNFSQGESNAQYTVDITNNGPGSTGDPSSGSYPMKVTDTLPTGLTYSTFSGTNWSCTPSGGTVTCTNDSAIAEGDPYPALTIDVDISGTLTGTVMNQITAGGAGTANKTSNTDSATILVPPAITSPGNTSFTSGSLGTFTVTTTGTPTAALSEIGALPPGVTFTDNGNGTATIAGTPGLAAIYVFTITAQNGASPNAMQTFTLSVSPGPATHLVIPGGPEPFYTAFSFTISAYDAFGNLATSYDGTIAFTSSDPGFVNLGPVTLVNGTGSQTGVLKTAGTDSITATDTTNPSITGTGFFTVQPGTATHIVLTAPSSAYVGSPISITLTAYDLYGNVATSYGGTVVFTSSDPSAILPGSSAITNGTGTFSATMGTVGTQTITATDAANSLTAQTGNISVTQPTLVVTTANDDAGAASQCTIQTTPGTGTDASCSLRDALLFAASEGSGSITFDSTAFAVTNPVTLYTIHLANGTLNIPASTTILGPTAGTGAALTNLVAVDGAGASSVFTVNSGVTGAAIANLIVTNGSTGTSGGGISNSGTLTVRNSTISNNAANGGFGGGISNAGTLTLNNSTISGNSATTGQGGGIFNTGTVTVTNTTIAGNTASGGTGGGVMNVGGGTLTVIDSTISGNSATGGGGIYGVGTTVSLANSIVSGNTADADIDGGFIDNGGNQAGVSGINLAPLANYGGPTQTMPALPGSAAICAGTLANWNTASLTADQRGFGLHSTYCPIGSVDSGAVQTNYALAFTTEPPASAIVGEALSPAPVVELTESLVAATAATSSIAMSGGPAVLGGTTVENLASGAATFSNLSISQLSSDALLTATLSLNASKKVNLTAQASTEVATVPISIALTASGSTLAGPVETFTWTAVPGAATYDLWLGTTKVGSNNLWGSGQITATSVTFGGLPTNGETIYARLWVTTVNGTQQHFDYTFTAATRAALTLPTPDSTLTSPSATFTWSSGVNAVAYTLWLGTTGVGSNNVWGSGITKATSVTFSALPTNGQTIYARLYTFFNGGVAYSDFTYTEVSKAILTLPTPNSTLTGPSATFMWTPPTTGATSYALWLGTTGPGSNNLWGSGSTTATSVTFNGLPTNGATIYARLFTYFSGGSGYADYTYTAATPAQLTSPTPNSTFTGASETFQWTTVSSATHYSIWVGSTGPGTNDLGFTQGGTTTTSFTLNSLPTNGETIYVRLWTNYPSGGPEYIDYTFTAF